MELKPWPIEMALKRVPKWPIFEERREPPRFPWLKESETALIFLLTCAGKGTYGYFKTLKTL